MTKYLFLTLALVASGCGNDGGNANWQADHEKRLAAIEVQLEKIQENQEGLEQSQRFLIEHVDKLQEYARQMFEASGILPPMGIK